MAVHQSTIPDVEKFGYLRDYLKGEAQLCVENLELTDANYAVAIATLRRTYGNQDVLIDAHMNKLDSLTQIKDASDTSAIRCFQLSIQSHINALVNLGIAKTSHGGLGSRILRAIPHKLQTEWSKSATNKVTDIDHVLTFLQEQVEAAERLSRLKPQTPKAQTNGQVAKTPSTTQATASQLNVGVVPKTTPNSKSKTKKGWAAHLQKEEGRLPLQERRCFHAFFVKRCTGLRIVRWSSKTNETKVRRRRRTHHTRWKRSTVRNPIQRASGNQSVWSKSLQLASWKSRFQSQKRRFIQTRPNSCQSANFEV